MGWKESESLVKKVKQNKICGEDSWWERDEKQEAKKAVDHLLLYKIQYKPAIFICYFVHCPAKNLNRFIKTEPVTEGANAMAYTVL